MAGFARDFSAEVQAMARLHGWQDAHAG